MEKELRILMLEDSSPDADLVMRELRKGGIRFVSRQVWTETDFQNQLREFHPELILADYSLPNFDGLSALAIVKKSFPDLPFIFVSGVSGEETAVNALHQGARDYILKNRLFHLVPAVQRTLREVDEQKKHKQVEDAYRKSSEEIRDLYNNAPCGYHSLDKDGVFIRINDTELKWLGYDGEELVGKKKFTDIMTEESLKKFSELFTVFKEQGWMNDVEFDIIRKDGTILPALISSTAFKDSRGNFVHSRSTIYDMTERKKSEDEIKKSEEKFRLLLDSAGEAIFGVDMEGNCTFCNPACIRLLGYVNPEDLTGKNMHSKIHYGHADGTEFTVEECRIFKTFREGKGRHVDDEIFWKADGSSFSVEYWSYPQWHNGMIVGAVVTFVDITERKRIQQKMEASLREKELLLREINHRVKNNLQVVKSLLNLQVKKVEDKKVKEIFENSRSRVQAIALVHEKLYKSKDLSKIDAKEYFTDLISGVFESLGADAHRIVAEVKVDKNVDIEIDKIIHCGIIVNELITNAVKYAFPEGKKGKIVVEINSSDCKTVLKVSDTGIGLPGNIGIEQTRTLGLELVRILSNQLGTLEIDRSAGTTFKITF